MILRSTTQLHLSAIFGLMTSSHLAMAASHWHSSGRISPAIVVGIVGLAAGWRLRGEAGREAMEVTSYATGAGIGLAIVAADLLPRAVP